MPVQDISIRAVGRQRRSRKLPGRFRRLLRGRDRVVGDRRRSRQLPARLPVRIHPRQRLPRLDRHQHAVERALSRRLLPRLDRQQYAI